MKYKLTDETINHLGKTLYRIVALKQFADVVNGEKGGFVESHRMEDRRMTQICTTLKKIREAGPCEEGWKKLLKHLGKKREDSKDLPISVILESNGLDDTLWSLRTLPEYNNLWRKYAVWCARQVQHLMADRRSLDALDVAWRHSNGDATDDDLAAAWDAARAAARDAARAAARAAAWDAAWDAAGDAARVAARAAARAAAWAAAWDAAWDAAGDAARVAAGAAARAAAWDAQANKLLQIADVGEWVE